MFGYRFLFIAAAIIFAVAARQARAIVSYGPEEGAEVVTYQQPNEGTPVTFQGKMWGNALFWEEETESGYTIVQNSSSGYWCYAVLNSAGDYTYSGRVARAIYCPGFMTMESRSRG